MKSFKEATGIAECSQTGKVMVLAEMQERIHRVVAFHFGIACAEFKAGLLHEYDIYNAD